MMGIRLRTVLSIAALLLCTSAFAAPHQTLFDFEEQVGSANCDDGSYTSLTSIKGELTLSLQREYDDRFDVFDLSVPNWGGCSPGWGKRSLSQYYSDWGCSFIANFSHAVTSVEIEYGDYNYDRDRVFLYAFSGLNGSGDELGSVRATLPATETIQYGNYWTLKLDNLQGAKSLVFGGGGSAATGWGPVYWDNLRVYAVPEPAFYQMGGLLLFGGLGAMRLRKRA